MRYLMFQVSHIEGTSMSYLIANQRSYLLARYRFLGTENMILCFNYFAGSNKEKLGGQQKEEFL